MPLRPVATFLLVLCLAQPLSADDAPWKADAEKAGLSRPDIEKLAKQRVLVTNQTHLQMFSPYVGPSLPPFITSDSILDGYFALLEESLSRMERANARLLPGLFLSLWKGLESGDSGDPRVEDPEGQGLCRAQVYLATAAGLVGVELPGVPEDVARIAAEEVARVMAATGNAKPEWLGPPDHGFVSLDYRRFKPRGIYSRSKNAEAYFRAISWLQAIPFRLKQDTELSSILLIARGLLPQRFEESPEDLLAYRTLLRQSRELVGPGDSFDLLDLTSLLDDGESSHGDVRHELFGDADRLRQMSRVNDQDAFAHHLSIRVISAAATPDAVLFSRTTGLGGKRSLPSGLEVAGLLGSEHAMSLLSGAGDRDVVRRIEASKSLLAGGSLYVDTLRCLSTLFEPPDRAPSWLAGQAWQTKTLNTGLAGWARLRHSLALHIKLSRDYKALIDSDPGHVEPAPQFFAALGRLAWKAEAIMLRNKALLPDHRAGAEVLRELVSALERAVASEKVLESLSIEEWELLDDTARRYPLFDEEKPIKPQVRAYIEELTKLADDVAAGKARIDACDQGWLVEEWTLLMRICEKLEAIAGKELSGEKLSLAEKTFIEEYGKQLATLYGYKGNSWLTPRDDAPRVIDVHVGAEGESRLLVGVARARSLYVLLETDQGDVLCRGAIRPYYEFARPEPMTDDEWRELLDSEKRPEPPDWLRNLLGEHGLGLPEISGRK